MKEKNNILLISIFFVFLIVIITIGLTYAYFVAIIQNENSAINTTGSSAKLAITYTNDQDKGIIKGNKILPGWTSEKKFTITGENTNTASKSLEYDILMVIEQNTFEANELKYKLEGNNYNIEEYIQINPTNNKFSLFKEDVPKPSFAGGTTSQNHEYTLTVSYPDLPTKPQYSEGQQFSARIIVESDTKMTR